MRALHIRDMGPSATLHLVEVPDPEPAEDELLVRIVATSVNRADLMQRAGQYPPPPGESDIPGLEMAGVVEAAGARCSRFAPGDRVFSLLGSGGYAEKIAIPEVLAMPVPPQMDLEEAGAIPEVFITAWQALHWLGHLSPRETVLLHGGASGVGTAATQLARLAGARVLVTASAPKHELCLSLGAEAAIDYKAEDFAERVPSLTGGRGADVIVDLMGAPYLRGNLKAAAMDGRIVMLAAMGGTRAESVNLGVMLRKRLTLVASTLRNRSLDYKARLARDFEEKALPAFADGRLRAVVDRRYDWTDVEQAHARMAANETRGKLVLRVSAP